MITIHIHRNQQNEILGFCVKGHAGTAPYGEDLVCAAVSMVTQTILIGLYEVLEQQPAYQIEEGYLWCKLSESLNSEQRREASILLETMVRGLENIQQQDPDSVLIREEVQEQ